VFPLDNRKAQRASADIAGRPASIPGTTQLLFPGMQPGCEAFLDVM